MKKFYFLLASSFVLASCGGGGSSSAPSSEFSAIDPEVAFAKFKETGTAYSTSDNLGYYTDDLCFSMNGVTIDDEDKENAFDLDGTDIKLTAKANNVNDSTASNLKGSLVFEEGSLSMSMPEMSSGSFSVSRLRPAMYLKDYTAYIDLSENGSIRVALNTLITSMQPSWVPAWSFPSKGKGYREIKPHSTVDNYMPIGGDSSSANAWADALKDNYENNENAYTFTLTKEKNSIVFASTDKALLQKIAIEQFEKKNKDMEEEDKKEYEDKIKNFFAAATIKQFELGFEYNDSVWTGQSYKIEADLDKEIEKQNDPDADYYLDYVNVNTNLSLLSGSDALISFPEDVGKKGESDAYKYEQIPIPIIL